MAEDKNKMKEVELQEEQLNEVSGGEFLNDHDDNFFNNRHAFDKIRL